MLKSVLIIRFSSIGDIVLTSPLIRALKSKFPEVNITFLTKAIYKPLLEYNPYINKIITIHQRAGEALEELRNMEFDLVLDLHKNYRSTFIKLALGVKSSTFFKSNLKKWRMINLKTKEIVEPVSLRYLKTVANLGVEYDNQGLDLFIPDNLDISKFNLPPQYVAVCIGGKYKTKCMPALILNSLIDKLKLPVVVLGGKDELELSKEIFSKQNTVINLVDQCDLLESSKIIAQSKAVISNDTGLMHISSALKKPLAVVWGSTVPEFGFSPFYPEKNQDLFKNFEVKSVSCRPCSKIGFASCPKKHFNCMLLQDTGAIAQFINKFC